MFEPLYTAEPRCARPRAGHDVAVLMDRAGKAVADLVLQDFDELRTITVVCGGGNNGGDGRVAARYLEQAGREVRIVDAKAGETDLGEPERDRRRAVRDRLLGRAAAGRGAADRARSTPPTRRSSRSTSRRASTRRPGRWPARPCEATCTVTFHGEKVGLTRSRRARFLGRLRRRGRRHRAGAADDAGAAGRRDRHPGARPAPLAARQQVLRRLRARRRRLARDDRRRVRSPRGPRSGPTPATSRSPLRPSRSRCSRRVVLEAVKRPLDDVFDAAGRAARARDRAGPRARRRAEGPRAPAAAGDRPAGRRRRRCAVRAGAVLAGRADGAHAALGRARPPARRRVRAGSTLTACDALDQAVERFGCVVLLKGSRHARRRTRGRADRLQPAGRALATAGTGDVLTGIVGAFLAKGMDARLAAAAAATAHTHAAMVGRACRGPRSERRRRGAPARAAMPRSEVTIDLGALRRNVARLRSVLGGTELWAVVKADGVRARRGRRRQGRGGRGRDGPVRRDRGRGTVPQTCPPGTADRRPRPDGARSREAREAQARARRLATGRSRRTCPSTSSSTRAWAGTDSGSSRRSPANVVGLMTHLATADSDPATFARRQLARFREATAGIRADPARREQRRGAAVAGVPLRCGSAAASRSTASRRSAPTRPTTASSRCSPGGASWRRSSDWRPGESTGYGRTLRRRAADVDRARPASATGTASGAT